jgi:hypothetical protein
MMFPCVEGGENNQATYYDLKVHWTLKHAHMTFKFITLA